MKPSATCELFVDDVRVPDTDAALLAGRVTALTGLSIAWGRDGPNEQPGPATCDFSVVDPAAGDSFLDLVHVGSAVSVYATGQIPAAGQTTYDNGSFLGRGGAVTATQASMVGGATGKYLNQALQLVPPKPSASPWPGVIVPPRTFITGTQLPTAWDTIAKASAGESWRVKVSVIAAPGVAYQIGLAAYSGPRASNLISSGFAYTMNGAAGVGTGAWQTYDLTAQITALPAAAWLAIRVDHTADPWAMGRWQDQGTITWDTATGTWNSDIYRPGLVIDDLALYPPSNTLRRVLAFSGDVTDIKITPDSAEQITVQITAADIGSELGNRVIGDNPWVAQPAGTRANRILDLAGIPQSKLSFDPALATLQLSYRDVDAQPTFQLLQDLAQSVGGTLWTAAHISSGSYLLIENPATRSAVKTFSWATGGQTVDATNQALNPIGPGGGQLGWWVPSRVSLAAAAGYIRATITDASTTNALAQRFNSPPTVGSVDRLLVKPGDVVRVRSKARSSVSFPMINSIQFLDAAGASLGQTYSASVVTNPTTPVDLPEHTATAPANATWAIIQIGLAAGTARAVNDTFDVAQVLITINGIAGTPYFDGDTAPTPPYSYQWTGVAQASTSQRLSTAGAIVITGGGAGALPLSACDLLMAPASWEQDSGDVITVVALTWLEQTLDDDGLPAPTERTIIVQDDPAIATYGTRRLSYATELTSSSNGLTLANRLLATARTVGWRMDGATLDTLLMPDELTTVDDQTRAQLFLNLLDATLRMGLAVHLVDLPVYAPGGSATGMYVEGGKYSYDDGGWSLALTVVPSGGQGKSGTWGDLKTNQPGWRWRDFDPSVRWQDCFGTAVPAA